MTFWWRPSWLIAILVNFNLVWRPTSAKSPSNSCHRRRFHRSPSRICSCRWNPKRSCRWRRTSKSPWSIRRPNRHPRVRLVPQRSEPIDLVPPIFYVELGKFRNTKWLPVGMFRLDCKNQMKLERVDHEPRANVARMFDCLFISTELK